MRSKFAKMLHDEMSVNDKIVLMPGDTGWSPANTVKQKMKLLITDPSSEYQTSDSDDRFDLLNEIRSEFARGAWTKMYELDPRLKIKFEDPEKLLMGFN